jgi:hypothetical protein
LETDTATGRRTCYTDACEAARLWRDRGRKLLASAYGWFTEGFDALELKAAEALLGELHA